MRLSVLATFVLLGCGGSAPRPSPIPLDDRPAQVIDVAELTPPAPGFRFSTTIHRSAGEAAVDAAYAVEVVAEDRVKITFTTGQQTVAGVVTTWPLAAHDYDVSTAGVTHLDGTEVSDDEMVALTAFYSKGGLSLPVREALVGHRLVVDEPLALDADGLMNLLVLEVSPDATGELVLHGIGADGIAEITFSGESSDQGGAMAFRLTGKATLDASTLMPRTLDYETATDSATGSSSQTFTYE